jgi:hypothetical protein
LKHPHHVKAFRNVINVLFGKPAPGAGFAGKLSRMVKSPPDFAAPLGWRWMASP